MATNEFECVEWVFGLTTMLETKPWSVVARSPNGLMHGTKRPYWYPSAPEYTGHDFDSMTTRTVIQCLLYTTAETSYFDEHGEWTLVASFTSSGECECPLIGMADEEDEEPEVCPYCDVKRGEEHGDIYIGDGWAECVYALAAPMLEFREFNTNDWRGWAGAERFPNGQQPLIVEGCLGPKQWDYQIILTGCAAEVVLFSATDDFKDERYAVQREFSTQAEARAWLCANLSQPPTLEDFKKWTEI